ncbi:hypothetical protein IE81DRAFT_326264 [Ceraceosorus guamensis]|uniref:Uncharacterized protein n=1 Tax=Ceraceosorus guamensis TaxID=1522189 RepID=A0A316VQ41_9BASI|nr:hypothetical protein IE81DRAFT_326264 [Ceraceosorus guamensis]PWN39706.1 hypothetical protein IE81DRAFT_326264 [Ceraceosorus guamensis]
MSSDRAILHYRLGLAGLTTCHILTPQPKVYSHFIQARLDNNLRLRKRHYESKHHRSSAQPIPHDTTRHDTSPHYPGRRLATMTLGQALTEDEVDEILYCARIGDIEELRAAIGQSTLTHQTSEASPGQNTRLSGKEALDVLQRAVTEEGNSALHYAAANGHMAVVSEIVASAPLDLILLANTSGNTPVHWAALNGHLHCVQALVDRVENLSPTPSIPPPRADGDGSEAGEEERNRRAAEARSTWDTRNKAGRGPMSEAQLAGKEEVVQWLLGRMIGGPTPSASKEQIGQDTPQDSAVEETRQGVEKSSLQS